jgi:hypothetical protein
VEINRKLKLSGMGIGEEGLVALEKYGVRTLGDLLDLDVEDAEVKDRDARTILRALLEADDGKLDRSDRDVLRQIKEGGISAQDGLALFVEGMNEGLEEDEDEEDWDEEPEEDWEDEEVEGEDDSDRMPRRREG